MPVLTAEKRSLKRRSLDGITVVSLEHAIAVPSFATSQLALTMSEFC
jgi:hypothetical protein